MLKEKRTTTSVMVFAGKTTMNVSKRGRLSLMVMVEQGLLGRMLGYGNIVVRGTGGTAEPFKNVRSPLEFRGHVQQQSEDLATT
jgi:hypothetical protein